MKVPTWANPHAERLKRVAMKAPFTLEKKGNWKQMTNQWQSLRFPQGWIPVNKTLRKGWVATYVCEWGYLGFRVQLERRGGLDAVKFGDNLLLKQDRVLEPVFVKD